MFICNICNINVTYVHTHYVVLGQKFFLTILRDYCFILWQRKLFIRDRVIMKLMLRNCNCNFTRFRTLCEVMLCIN